MVLPRGGARGVLYLLDWHVLKVKARLGFGSNDFLELIALKIVLSLILEYRVTYLSFWMFFIGYKLDEEDVCLKEFYFTTFAQ